MFLPRTTAPLGRPCSVPIVIADTETNGLTLPHLPGGRRAWEYALSRRDPDGHQIHLDGFIDLADLPFSPADPALDRVGLDIGRFFERHPQVNPAATGTVYPEADMARLLMEFFRPARSGPDGRPAKPWLIGAVPGFEDAQFGDLLRRHALIAPGEEYPWNYHLLCVEVFVAGRLRARPPWNARTLSRRAGVDIARYDAHTARGDVDWAAALYDGALRPPLARLGARARLEASRALRGLRGRR